MVWKSPTRSAYRLVAITCTLPTFLPSLSTKILWSKYRTYALFITCIINCQTFWTCKKIFSTEAWCTIIVVHTFSVSLFSNCSKVRLFNYSLWYSPCNFLKIDKLLGKYFCFCEKIHFADTFALPQTLFIQQGKCTKCACLIASSRIFFTLAFITHALSHHTISSDTIFVSYRAAGSKAIIEHHSKS